MSFAHPTLSVKQKQRQSMRQTKKSENENKKNRGSAKIKREFYSYQVLTTEEIIYLEMAFDKFDSSCDGKIPANKLGKLMRSLGQNPTEKELTDLINKYDDGSGKIDLEDFFILMYEKMHGIDIYLNTREMFRVFDKNENGSIPEGEMRQVLEFLLKNDKKGKFQDLDIDELIILLDSNRIGSIDFNGLFKFMTILEH